MIYFSQDSGPEGQRTVVTETRGPFAGHRVVRGRAAECLAGRHLDHAVNAPKVETA